MPAVWKLWGKVEYFRGNLSFLTESKAIAGKGDELQMWDGFFLFLFLFFPPFFLSFLFLPRLLLRQGRAGLYCSSAAGVTRCLTNKTGPHDLRACGA